jgi:hypothetical protein
MLTVSEGEEQAEDKRQALCSMAEFETYSAFSRIDRGNNGLITAVDLLEFHKSVQMEGVLSESDF